MSRARSSRHDRHLRVRMYAVGFGDAFLLLIPDEALGRPRRVLIDCGSIARKTMSMDEAVAAIIEDCRDRDGVHIDVIVATHRHRDHIAGFASPRWQEVEVGEVWLPWTEAPDDDAALQLRERQATLARALVAVAGFDADNADADALDRAAVMALNATPNQDAMRTLLEGFANTPRRRFLPETAKFPETLACKALPGVKVSVLGPSRDPEVIRALNPPSAESYLCLDSSGLALDGRGLEPFGTDWCIDEATYDAKWPALVPTDAECERIRGLDRDAGEGLAVALDHALNGTSLVLMFAIGDAHLLFPGDAQWGTWRRMLTDRNACALLQRTTLLKVGHHGSHNATPCSFVREHLPDSVRAMVSTRRIARWPEIPRGPLLDALAAKRSSIARSDEEPDPAGGTFFVDPQGHYIETRYALRSRLPARPSKAAKRMKPADPGRARDATSTPTNPIRRRRSGITPPLPPNPPGPRSSRSPAPPAR